MKNHANSQIRFIHADADVLSKNTKPALIILDISRKEIESGNISSVLSRLLALSDSRESTLLYRESLTFRIGGYDKDKRELPEIPEVRAFFAILAAEWPHWMWFLVRGGGSIALLMTLLCEVEIIPGGQGRHGSFGTRFKDVGEVRSRMFDLFSRGNALFECFDLPVELGISSTNSAVAEMLG